MTPEQLPIIHWDRIFPLLRWMPLVDRQSLYADFMAGLTGAVIVLPQGVAFNLIDFHHINVIGRTERGDSAVLLITFLATLFAELEFAIYAGVMLSLVLYLNRTARPRVYTVTPEPANPRHTMVIKTGLPECPQLRIIRIDGSLFFGAVSHIAESFHLFEQRDADRKHLLIIASGINFIDSAGIELLAQHARRLRKNGGALYLCAVKEGLSEPLRKSGNLDVIGPENIFRGKTEAISEIFTRLERTRCEACEQRIFNECKTVRGCET